MAEQSRWVSLILGLSHEHHGCKDARLARSQNGWSGQLARWRLSPAAISGSRAGIPQNSRAYQTVAMLP